MSGEAVAALPVRARGGSRVRSAAEILRSSVRRRTPRFDPLAARLPLRVGDSYRWPDGTWTHPG